MLWKWGGSCAFCFFSFFVYRLIPLGTRDSEVGGGKGPDQELGQGCIIHTPVGGHGMLESFWRGMIDERLNIMYIDDLKSKQPCFVMLNLKFLPFLFLRFQPCPGCGLGKFCSIVKPKTSVSRILALVRTVQPFVSAEHLTLLVMPEALRLDVECGREDV
jgi:hypothetical protein